MPDWTEISRCFEALRPDKWIEPKVSVFLDECPPDKPLIIACSGGADSVFLALTLLALRSGNRKGLVLAHYNHQLRGEDSDGDEAFVRDLAAALGLRFMAGRANAPLEPVESVLREARYHWLSTIYESERAGALVLGHHADDLVESFLMGLLGGSGPGGLASPMPVRRFPGGQVRLRPLLTVDRERIRRTLRSLGAPWREDSSNSDPRHTRNWLRQEIIPRLKERFPQDIQAAARRVRQLQEETLEALDAQVLNLGIDFSVPEELPVGSLRGAPVAVARRAFMGWWMRHQPDEILSKGVGDEILALITTGSPGNSVALSASGNHSERFISLTADLRLVLKEADSRPEWRAGCHWIGSAGPLFLPDGAFLRLSVHRMEPGASAFRRADPAREAWLQGVRGGLHVRQWQPGDRYRPLGAPGRRKLQDLFTDAKLETEQKHRLPVILDEKGQILWVPGFPPAHDFRICQEGISALQLTYVPHSPAFRLNYGG